MASCRPSAPRHACQGGCAAFLCLAPCPNAPAEAALAGCCAHAFSRRIRLHRVNPPAPLLPCPCSRTCCCFSSSILPTHSSPASSMRATAWCPRTPKPRHVSAESVGGWVVAAPPHAAAARASQLMLGVTQGRLLQCEMLHYSCPQIIPRSRLPFLHRSCIRWCGRWAACWTARLWSCLRR